MTRATAGASVALALILGSARVAGAQKALPGNPFPSGIEASTPDASAAPTAVQGTQTPTQPAQPPETFEPPSTAPLDNYIDASESENERRLLRWNHFDGKYFSLRLGGGFLYDYAAYSQDANAEEQFPTLEAKPKLRDFRLVFGGKLKFMPGTTWSAGFMYDGDNDEWVVRQTGIMVAIPKIWGDIFVGRSKEGFSMNKVMVGYGGWGIERAPISDATVPILADGIKWLGYLPGQHLIWNLGVFGDALSEGQGFSSYRNQIVGRVAWLPKLSPDGGTLVHLGVSTRYGKPKDRTLRLKARPGASPAPFFIDTGDFAADSTTMIGFEAYYRPGPFTFGSEYFLQSADAPASGNPFFHGGEVMMTWLITGEVRSYNTRGGYFNQIAPLRPIYSGGPGAWEVVTQLTYADENSGTLKGGTFWRFTPMLNWYLSDHIRLEFAYGYGSLDRFDLVGKTHFFQTRLQLQL